MISNFSSFILYPFKGLFVKCSVMISVYFCLLFCSQSVSAVDLLKIYQQAYDNDSVFQSEIYRHKASSEIYTQAFSEMLPVVSADAFYQRSRHEILDSDIGVFGDDMARYPSRGLNLVLSQPIFKYSSMVRISQAKEEVKRADLVFEAAGQDLILRVTETYLMALGARDIVLFTKSEEEAVSLHFNLAKERYENGLAPITDYHDAKARLASVTTKRIRSENNLEDALEGIAELTGERMDSLATIRFPNIKIDAYYNVVKSEETKSGIDIDNSKLEKEQGSEAIAKNLFNSLVSRNSVEYTGDTIPLIPPFPDNIVEWVDSAKKQNLQVLIKEKALEVARQEVKRQNGGHLPTVTLVGRWNRDIQGGSLFGGQSDIEKWEGILEVKIPIFNGFSVSSKVREAVLLLKAAEEDLKKETRSVTRESKAAFLGIKSSIDNIISLKQAMVSNQIALEAKKEGFKSGLFTSLAVTDAERDLHQAKQEYARSQYEYILNSLKLKKAVGLLKEDDIAVVNSWLK